MNFLPPDYHMHTPLCHHAVGEPVDYAARAAELGLSEIGFSEHNPMAREDFDNWRMYLRDLDTYLEKVAHARRRYPDLTIRIALEVDYIPGYEDWIRELAGRHPWDYFIGSVHYVGNRWDIDNPEKLDQWRERPAAEVWAEYFDRLAGAAGSGLFDILGHPDLCKKFSIYPEEDCRPLYEKFLQAARQTGTAIEINTSGLRKECREMYPNSAIVKRAAELGVGLTFGSDAHAPGEVGMDFGKAVALARDCGYGKALRFCDRKAETYTLGE